MSNFSHIGHIKPHTSQAARAHPHRRAERVTRSGSEAALAIAIGPQGPQEVDPAEVRPVGLTEVELAVRALPKQEAPEPLLPRGTDHEIRIGLTLGVEVLGDVLDVEDFGELFDGRPGSRMLLEQRAHGINDRLMFYVRVMLR